MSSVRDIVDLAVYLSWYAAIILLLIFKWNSIWVAACGGNGKPQPNEVLKLGFVFASFIYANEIIHTHIKFDGQFGLFLLAGVGLANLGAFKLDNYKKILGSEKEKE